MPNCYFCGMEFENLKVCPFCNQSYCEAHFATNTHDCPLIPIKNPYEDQLSSGNVLVTPEELAAQPLIRPQGFQYSYSDLSTQNAVIHPSINQNLQTSHQVINNESNYVYTDGTYFWHRKDQIENLDEMDAFDPSSGIIIPGILWPKKSELFHVLFASFLLILLVSSGIIMNTFIQLYILSKNYHLPLSELLDIIEIKQYLIQIILLSILYLSAFLVHEFSHRQTAKHFKLQTKFRLFKVGVIMTFICLVLPIKFALPGAVVVIGLEEISRRTGLCKLAGPLSNLIMGSGLLLVSILPIIQSPLNYWLLFGATFNFSLGAFNMIPFGILDGDNIRKWQPKIWLVMMIALISLFLLSFYLQNQFTPI